jgi:hypothetical protein
MLLKQQDSELSFAAASGDAANVQDYLRTGAPVNHVNSVRFSNRSMLLCDVRNVICRGCE